jgi:hypothetical protein
VAEPTNPVLRALRPQPFRGDQVAAGVVVLATLLLLVDLRLAGTWSEGVRFVVTGLGAAFVGTMAVASTLETERPRAYQTVLYVATCLLTLLALGRLAHVLGAHDATHRGTLAWQMLLVGGIALAFSLVRNSEYCTLVAGLAFTIALVTGVAWLFGTHDAETVRWVMLLALVADLFGAVVLRDRRRVHAVMIVDVAGLTAIALAFTFLAAAPLPVDVVGAAPSSSAPWGWALVIITVGFSLVAYAGADRERGPGYLGVLTLVLFAVLAGRGEATLLGWPLVLALVAAAFLVLGLRPTHPLPPEPEGEERIEPRAVPLPRDDLPAADEPDEL